MPNLKKHFLIISAGLFFLLISSKTSATEFNITTRVTSKANAPTYAELLINNTVVVKIISDRPLPVSKRILTLAERMQTLISLGYLGADFKVTVQNKKVLIIAGKYLFMEVTDDEATLRGIKKEDLAKSWLSKIKSVLIKPTFFINPTVITIPVGETRRVFISGSASGEIKISPQENEVADISLSNDFKEVIIYGKNTGKVVFALQRADTIVYLTVIVKKYAAYLKKIEPVIVTGNPTPKHILKEVATLAAKKSLSIEDGCSIQTFIEKASIPSFLIGGKEISVKVPVKVWGKDFITFNNLVTITIKNEIIPFTAPKFLIVSNEPENIKTAGILMDSTINSESSIRLLFHHKNASKRKLDFSISVFNPGNEEVSLWVIKGFAGPAKEEINTGHNAALYFLNNYFSQAGILINIPAQQERTLLFNTLNRGKILSGIFYLKICSGNSLELSIKARNSYSSNLHLKPLSILPSPRKGIFAQPDITQENIFNAGGKWEFIKIGDLEVKDLDSESILKGNYGIIYNFSIYLNNPTEKKKKILIYFVPAGGIARGIFYIDDKLIETNIIDNSDELKIARYFLEPGESKYLKITTMPEAGSNYPVRLVIKDE